MKDWAFEPRDMGFLKPLFWSVVGIVATAQMMSLACSRDIQSGMFAGSNLKDAVEKSRLLIYFRRLGSNDCDRGKQPHVHDSQPRAKLRSRHTHRVPQIRSVSTSKSVCGTALVPGQQRFESSGAQRPGNYDHFVRQLLATHLFRSGKQTYSVTPCSSARPTMTFSELIDNYCVDVRNVN